MNATDQSDSIEDRNVNVFVCVLFSISKMPSISLALNTLTSSTEGSNKFAAGDEWRTGFKTATLENNFAIWFHCIGMLLRPVD